MPRGTRTRTVGKDGPHPVDVHVGQRLRMRRTLLGMSQSKLAEALGLTFQQLQKYEKGANRVSANRLSELSQILDVPVSFFFEDMSKDGDKTGKSDTPSDLMGKRETLEFVRAYYRISNPVIRKSVRDLAKAMAS